MGRPCPISAATLPHARELNQRSRQAGAAMFGSLGESISQIFGITQYALLVSGDLNAGNNWRSDAVKLPPATSRIRPSARVVPHGKVACSVGWWRSQAFLRSDPHATLA